MTIFIPLCHPCLDHFRSKKLHVVRERAPFLPDHIAMSFHFKPLSLVLLLALSVVIMTHSLRSTTPMIRIVKAVHEDKIEAATRAVIERLPFLVHSTYDTNTFTDGPIPPGSIYDNILTPREPQTHHERNALMKEIATVTAPCTDQQLRLGVGDGGKVLCQWMMESLQVPGCVVYSLGSNNDFSFEEAVLAQTRCTVHTFDCTINRPRETLKPRLEFYPFCIDANEHEHNGNIYHTLEWIQRHLHHPTVHLLKMDIETFEHRLLLQWKRNQSLPSLLSMEWHGTTPPIPGRYRRLSLGELALEYMHLVGLGYRVVYAEESGGGRELTLARLRHTN